VIVQDLLHESYASSRGDIRQPNQTTMSFLQEEDQTTEILVH